MAQKRPRDVAGMFPAAADLDCEIAIPLTCLVGYHLYSIHLNNRAGKRRPVSGSYMAVMPFLVPRAPVRSGVVKRFRSKAAAVEDSRTGRFGL